MIPKERLRIAMSGGKPDRVPVLPQICPPHAVLVAGLPYEQTLINRLEYPEKYDMLGPDCAVDYGVDGFRVFVFGAGDSVGAAVLMEPVRSPVTDNKSGTDRQIVPV